MVRMGIMSVKDGAYFTILFFGTLSKLKTSAFIENITSADKIA
jgi:hypothetical protein